MVVCPQCRQTLEPLSSPDQPVSLRCTGCGNNYPVVDGIPILLIERALASTGGEEVRSAPLTVVVDERTGR